VLNFRIAARRHFKDKERLELTMTKIFGAIAILGAIIAAVGHNNPVVTGLGKAIFGVFFIMAFLVKLAEFWTAEKPETTHDHGGLMGKGGGHGHH
jgi:hypothetical protein